jgi:hypothetical protein
MSMFYWCVESAFINMFVYFYYYNTTNKDFVFRNTNLAFKSIVIYNFIRYALGISVDKGILVEQPIRTCLNILDNLPATCVVNTFHLPVRKTKEKCQWCWLMKEEQHRTNYKCCKCHVNLCIKCFMPFHDFCQ